MVSTLVHWTSQVQGVGHTMGAGEYWSFALNGQTGSIASSQLLVINGSLKFARCKFHAGLDKYQASACTYLSGPCTLQVPGNSSHVQSFSLYLPNTPNNQKLKAVYTSSPQGRVGWGRINIELSASLGSRTPAAYQFNWPLAPGKCQVPGDVYKVPWDSDQVPLRI